ncbi:MAG: AAA family ATPase [Candidatus Omnitrophica bacterium]|nr:AAA family ATPase [Candidatus Omnitrophota bacterium]
MNKLKKFIKYNWLKIIGITVGVTMLVGLVTLIIVGVKNFLTLESFYKKMTLASVPLQLFMGVIQAFTFASIYMGFHYWFMFGGGVAKMGQKKVKPEQVNVKWSDVIGMEGMKREVAEVISLLRDRTHLKMVGGRIIKGLLMVGPPGCGKTYLAKAIATETGMPFLAAVGSEFIGMFVGVGATKIRNLFKEARMLAEYHGGCLIFIDEIDTIARPRVGVSGLGGGMSYNATVNQLLTELDGLSHTENNIVVVAATNVPEDQLDPALMRAGRFDRKIYVGKPGLKDRKDLFDFYLKKVSCDPEIKTDVLAQKAVGFSPADIANMVREASLIVVRNKQKQVTYKDLSEAYDRVVFGLKSQIVLSEKERYWTAYHETGHAIIAYLTHPTDDVIKASIVPRKGALGYVGHRPTEEIHAPSSDWFFANIKTCLGGYAAEKIKFGQTTSGVTSDFNYATKLAHSMVCRYGMGESGMIGDFCALNQGNVSEETKRKLDDDMQKIMTKCLREVEEILTAERELIEHFASELLRKDELEFDEIVEIFEKYGKERPANTAL